MLKTKYFNVIFYNGKKVCYGGPSPKKIFSSIKKYRIRNLKFATSKTLVNFMKKMMFLSKNWYFSVQKALIHYTVYKSHHNSFILLVFSHVENFRYVANFRFLTLQMNSFF